MKNTKTVPQFLVRIFVRPFFPFFQWLVIALGIIKAPTKRGDFLVGKLKEGVDYEKARETLEQQGFFANRIAHNEPGQVLSMRRLSVKNPEWQYHIRVFNDGEIRGHCEVTPSDHPIDHLNLSTMEHRPYDFAKWIKDIT
jgi:hypothetical protein